MSLNGPSLTGLRRVLAEDRNYARIQAEAARGFAARSEDYQISAPAGMRSTLLAEMADGLTTLAANETGCCRAPGRRRCPWSWPSPRPAARPRT